MDANTLLLIQAMAVLAMMIVLAFIKHRSRRSGLPSFVRRHSKRQRFIRAARLTTPQVDVDDAEDTAIESEANVTKLDEANQKAE